MVDRDLLEAQKELTSHAFGQAQAYTNLILVAGYADRAWCRACRHGAGLAHAGMVPDLDYWMIGHVIRDSMRASSG